MSDDKNGDIIVNKFTEESSKNFREKLLKRSFLDPNLPIIIYIDSYGGSVDALNSMLATMRQLPNPMVTVCVGKAMSCGAILLAAGDHRFCDSGSRILIHEVSGGSIESVNEMENDVKEARRLNNQMMNFLAKRCGKTYKDIKQIMHNQDSRNIILTAKQSLDFGIIDYIGMPIIKPIIMYSIETMSERKYEKSQSSSFEEALLDLSLGGKTKKKKKKIKKKKIKKKITKKKKVSKK